MILITQAEAVRRLKVTGLSEATRLLAVTREIRETALTVKNELNIRDYAKGAVRTFKTKA